LHLLHQSLHAPGLQKRRGRLRLRILPVPLAFQAHQAGDLVLLVLVLMHPRPTTHVAGTQPPAIDLDGNHLRHGGHADRQFATALLSGLVVALPGQFATHLQGDALDVTGTDLDPGQVQGEGSVGEGVQPGGGLSDPL